jgi:hypothetical protein
VGRSCVLRLSAVSLRIVCVMMETVREKYAFRVTRECGKGDVILKLVAPGDVSIGLNVRNC